MLLDDFTELHAGSHSDHTDECCALEAAAVVRVGHKGCYLHSHGLPNFIGWNDLFTWESPAHRARVMIPVLKAYWQWQDMDKAAICKRIHDRINCRGTYVLPVAPSEKIYTLIFIMVDLDYTHEQIAEVLIDATN